MVENKIKVYVNTDESHNIIKIFSSVFEQPAEASILIDEGYGDKYAHAQSQYFDKPLMYNGVYRYQYIDGKVIEKSDDEIQAEISSLPKPETEASQLEKPEGLVYYVGMMTEVL